MGDRGVAVIPISLEGRENHKSMEELEEDDERSERESAPNPSTRATISLRKEVVEAEEGVAKAANTVEKVANKVEVKVEKGRRELRVKVKTLKC